MKLSIWQVKFSSNHSASFFVVGKFQTAADAQQVAETMRSILVRIATWYEQQYAEFLGTHLPPPGNTYSPFTRFDVYIGDTYGRDWEGQERYRLTEVEETLKQEYGLSTWLTRIDYAWNPVRMPEAVRVMDNLVLITEDFLNVNTWTGPNPFPELVKKFGGEAGVVSERNDYACILTLTCTAPDEYVAQLIIDSLGIEDLLPWEPDEIQFSLPEGSFDTKKGNIYRDGEKLIFKDLWIAGYGNTAFGLINLIEYLKRFGCVDFDYHFPETPRGA